MYCVCVVDCKIIDVFTIDDDIIFNLFILGNEFSEW